MAESSQDRLKFARLAAGFETATEFAVKHRIPQPTYANHETGKRGLRLQTAERYAEYLGNCDAAWLLTGHGRAPNQAGGKVSAARAVWAYPPEVLGEIESSGAVPLADGSMALGFLLRQGKAYAFPMDRQAIENIRENLKLIEAHLTRAGA